MEWTNKQHCINLQQFIEFQKNIKSEKIYDFVRNLKQEAEKYFTKRECRLGGELILYQLVDRLQDLILFKHREY